MPLIATLAALVACAAAFALATWRSRKPVPPGEVRHVPYGMIQFIALLGCILTLAHLVTLLTGTPFKGRLGF